MALSFLSSCKNDDDTPILIADHYPLSIGNYWVYQNVGIDSIGVETINTIIDSIVIKSDTVLNTKRYFILEGIKYTYNSNNWGIIDLLRDSAGYIINQNGIIRFAEYNFIDTLAKRVEVYNLDTLYTLSFKMEKVPDPVTLLSGTYEVYNCKGTVLTPKEYPGVNNPRYLNNYYADGVGNVLSTHVALSSPYRIEKRLLRYKTDK